jgi:hypothetical protein
MGDINRYHKGKIYSIRSHQTQDIYIGSTIQPLYKRLSGHKRNYKKWKDGNLSYTTSYEIVKYSDCYIELIEDYKCENITELNRREGQIIRETENCINKKIAGRTQKEYDDERKMEKKQYRDDHKERCKIMNKKWREANKEYRLEYGKQYYQKNKEKIKQYNKIKYTCECGITLSKMSKSTHERSKKHKAYIESLKKNDNCLDIIL